MQTDLDLMVTIGITTYNAELTIEKAVISALQQDCPNFEIVIVDDKSKDKTWNILKTLECLCPNKIRVFRNEKNLGVAGTRNRILFEANGEFIAFFDDDDVSQPDRLTKQIQRIVDYERNHAGGAMVICHTARRQVYDNKKEVIAQTLGCDVNALAPCGEDMAAHILYNKKISSGNGSLPTCSQLARLSVYKKLGGFDENFRRMEDTEFNIRLAMSGGHFVGISEPLVVQTMTRSEDKIIGAERKYALLLYKKYESFLVAAGRSDFDVEWLEAKHDYWEGYRLRLFFRLLKLFLLHPILSSERFVHSLPNSGYNRAVRGFHGNGNEA